MSGNSGEKLAQIKDLTITYARPGEPPIHALHKVSLDIHAGEIVGMLGESGSGKSTLALALMGLLPEHAQYQSGCILFRGQDLLQLGETALLQLRGKEVSLIVQDPALSLNPVIKVGDQVAEVIRAHTSDTRKQRRSRALELLTEVGFDKAAEIYDAYPHQLSGGQRQRIAISQAIACRPALIIADEPTSKLDAVLQSDIMALLSGIQGRHGVALLVITHNPSLLMGFADRVVVMYAGQIVEDASTIATFREPFHPYTQALMRLHAARLTASGERRSAQLPVIDGLSPDLSCSAPGCRFEPRCSDRMEICLTREPPVFMPKPSRRVNCFKYAL